MPSRRLVLDIETAAQPDAEVNPRVLDYHRAKWAARGEVDEELERAVNWPLGKVICIAAGIPDAQLKVISFTGDEEALLLADFWTSLKPVATPDTQFIGFNSLSFDFAYLLGRSAVRRVRPTFELPLRRFDPAHHFDVRMMLTNWDQYRPGNLEYWADVFGISYAPDVCRSADIAARYRAGDFAAIRAHCEEDVRVTWELYRRLNYLP